MAALPILNKTGEQVGTYDFDPAELVGEVNKQLLHDAVVMYEANRRVGTVRTKSRGEVSGSTKKIFKQKGTGRARMGTKRTGIRRGGGNIHAKRPIDWGYRLTKKALSLATRMALRSKFDDNQVIVLDDMQFAQPRTKEMVSLLKAVGVGEQSCLVATAKIEPLVYKSGRNIPTVQVLPASDLNTYVLLQQRHLVVTKAALDALREKHSKKSEAKGDA